MPRCFDFLLLALGVGLGRRLARRSPVRVVGGAGTRVGVGGQVDRVGRFAFHGEVKRLTGTDAVVEDGLTDELERQARSLSRSRRGEAEGAWQAKKTTRRGQTKERRDAGVQAMSELCPGTRASQGDRSGTVFDEWLQGDAGRRGER